MPSKKPASDRSDQAAHILLTRERKRRFYEAADAAGLSFSTMAAEAIEAWIAARPKAERKR